jgi:uncharacterized LabA/DUF88 family protein
MENNYFFIDGSSLLSDIKRFRTENSELSDKKFNIITFSRLFSSEWNLKQFHSGIYRRIVFYFVKNDSRLVEYLEIPNFKEPGLVEDIQIKYCGKKITSFSRADDWLDKMQAPSYVRDSLYKSEKAVDTQICCDALVLLSLNKLDRLFLYTNDYDFIPLCKAIKTMGCNINLIRLNELRVNGDLVFECDAFFAFDLKSVFRCFGINKVS